MNRSSIWPYSILWGIFFSCGAGNLSAAVLTDGNWIRNPFENKVFIENNNQFGSLDSSGKEKILFFVNDRGIEVRLLNDGIDYKFTETEVYKNTTSGGHEEFNGKRTDHFVHMRWTGCNSEARIVREKQSENYFTYADFRHSKIPGTILANGYAQIKYLDIYPGIDLVFSFPEKEEGIKYAFVLHPGADPANIRMKYSGTAYCRADVGGNIVSGILGKEIVDHAPVSYTKSGRRLTSAFVCNQEEVSFSIDLNASTEDVVIDPWVSVPVFTGRPTAYDVDSDDKGNVYVYGGSYPFQLVKFDKLGNHVWTYTNTVSSAVPAYGDFAVDPFTGSSFMIDGYEPPPTGAWVIAVNTAGYVDAMNYGDPNMNESWRIAYNACSNNLVIGAGGTIDTYQAALVDINLVNYLSRNILNAFDSYHDIPLLATNNQGDVFFGTAREASDDFYDNLMVKSSMNALVPTVFTVPDHFHFMEGQSVLYYGLSPIPNGYNGMAATNEYVFVYDGVTLRKFDVATGHVLGTRTVGSTVCAYGGITVSECGTLYLTSEFNHIEKYDFDLNPVSTMIAGDSLVCDLKLDDSGHLYACGMGFVQSFVVADTACPRCLQELTHLNFPNVFTPNGDGRNDFFQLTSFGYESIICEVYDRWGRLVHNWDGVVSSWDGNTSSGNQASTGTYYYHFLAATKKGLTHVYNGFLELKR